MKQLTEKQAINFFESGVWKDWNAEQLVRLQIFQDRLCVPWETFHKAMKDVLGRPVYTHEFMSSNRDSLTEEYLGTKEAPTLEEIINLIPQEKRIIIQN